MGVDIARAALDAGHRVAGVEQKTDDLLAQVHAHHDLSISLSHDTA
jgi:hypothetical protein